MSTNVVRLRCVTSFGLINKTIGKKSKYEHCCNVPHLPLQICRSWKQQWHNSRQRAHSPSRTESINWCKARINFSVSAQDDYVEKWLWCGLQSCMCNILVLCMIWEKGMCIGILDTASYKQLDQWKVTFSLRHSFNRHWSLLCVFVIKVTCN
jgi:hypothetical protein